MAERRKSKKKREADAQLEDDKPSKVEYEVAKYLRNKLPQKQTFLMGHKVDYFISSKSIDCLLDSPWAIKQKDQKEALFTSRDSIVDFMQNMLRDKFFHRARKIIVSSKDSKKKKMTEQEEGSAAEEKSTKKKEKKETEKKKDKEPGKEEDVDGGDKGKEVVKEEKEKKKEKKKVKFDMHMDQVFVDGNEPYVWIYDPVPLKAWIIGACLVFGAVAVCLFPLWPRTVRNYVYYLSIAAAGFLFFIIGLAVLRVIVFGFVWLVTFGKHHLWLLPNLTEDVGFLESFWPLYHYEYKGPDKDTSKEKEECTPEEKEELLAKDTTRKGSVSEHSESDSQSIKTANGTNSDNGFEILDPKDAHILSAESEMSIPKAPSI